MAKVIPFPTPQERPVSRRSSTWDKLERLLWDDNKMQDKAATIIISLAAIYFVGQVVRAIIS